MNVLKIMLPDQIHNQIQSAAHSAGIDTAQFCSSLLVEWACNENQRTDVNSPLRHPAKDPPSLSERETLKQLFALCTYYYTKHRTFNEAVNMTASLFHVRSTSVRDKCTRRIAMHGQPMGTNDFLNLLKDPQALRTHLCNRFPNESMHINSQLDQIIPTQTLPADPEPQRIPMLRIVEWVVTCLRHEFNGKGAKLDVEASLLNKHPEFNDPYWQKLVGAQPGKGFKGVPRWMKMVEFARNLAKEMGLIKPTQQSGRGQWELTEKGQNWSFD
jgi:hypothetical protein